MEKIPSVEKAPESKAVLASLEQSKNIDQEIKEEFETVRRLGNLDSTILNPNWQEGGLVMEGLTYQETIPTPEDLETDNKVLTEVFLKISDGDMADMANGNLVLRNSEGKFYELNGDVLGNLMDMARQYREGEIINYRESVEDEIKTSGREVAAEDLPETLKRAK